MYINAIKSHKSTSSFFVQHQKAVRGEPPERTPRFHYSIFSAIRYIKSRRPFPDAAKTRSKYCLSILLQASRADDTRVVAEACDTNLRLLIIELGETLLLDDRAQRRQQILALTGDTAADAQNVGLEDVDNVDQTRRQIADVLLDDLSAGVVARLLRVKAVLPLTLSISSSAKWSM